MANYTASAKVVEDCHYALDVTIPKEEVTAAFKKVRAQFRQHARIPGFRPGKAPANLINRRFGDKIVDDVRQELLRENLQKAIDEQKLQAVTYPRMIQDRQGQVAEGQDFSFAVEFDTKPDVSVPTYQGLELTRYKLEIKDSQVDQTIDDLRSQRASWEKVDRPAAAGDLVKVGYHSTIAAEDDVPDAAKRMVNVDETWLMLGQPEMFPGVAEGLAGLSAGEEKALTIKFPEDFYEPFLAGKEGEYTFTVAEVHGQQLPELTDEFCKRLGVETVDELKARVREQLESRLKHGQEEFLHNQVMEKLLDGVDFALPPTVFKMEVEQAKRELQRQHQHQHQDGEACDSEEHAAEIETEAATRAGQRLRLRYLIEAIAEAEKISVESGEIKQRMDMLRAYQGLTEQQFRERYNELAVAEGMYENAIREKVLDKVIGLAKITETDPPEAPAEKAE